MGAFVVGVVFASFLFILPGEIEKGKEVEEVVKEDTGIHLLLPEADMKVEVAEEE